MDPAALLDLLVLKLVNESKSGKAPSAFSVQQTDAVLRRLRTSDLAAWAAESVRSPNPALRRFATIAICDSLTIEDEAALVAKFETKDHADVRAWRQRLMPAAPRERRRMLVRSEFRPRLRHLPT